MTFHYLKQHALKKDLNASPNWSRKNKTKSIVSDYKLSIVFLKYQRSKQYTCIPVVLFHNRSKLNSQCRNCCLNTKKGRFSQISNF